MANAEGAKKIIAEVSGHDLDQWVRTESFTAEVEEVSALRIRLIFVQDCKSLPGTYTIVCPWPYSPGVDELALLPKIGC
jgi:hypothetical protein